MDKSYYLGAVSSDHANNIKKGIKDGTFNIKELLTLENENSVIPIMCANCLTILEGAQQNAEALAKAANIALPEDLHGKYFQTSSCLVCNESGNEEIEVKLKDVKELAN